jgi:hypothetical protein
VKLGHAEKEEAISIGIARVEGDIYVATAAIETPRFEIRRHRNSSRRPI